MTRTERVWTMDEAREDALKLHPDCSRAEVKNGMMFPFTTTWVVELWRNDDCYLAGDPPKYTEQSYVTA